MSTVAGVTLAIVNPGAVTVTPSGAVADDVDGPPHTGAQGPEPVTVAAAVPPGAPAAALSAMVNVVVPEAGVIVDVTPVGSPVRVRVTVPL
jgi:hypothetical protein